MYTKAEAIQHAAENERYPILVRETAGGYEAVYEGEICLASNPFGLDSLLDSAGAPRPRNLYLITEDEDV